MLLALASEKGERRLLERLGGAPLHVVAQRCDAAPERAGRNRVWSGCVVTVTGAPGRDTLSARLFGAIVERDGRYKILGYANDF